MSLHHRSTTDTFAFNVFHDLLLGFKRCNSVTLVSIIGRHRISIPPHTHLTQEQMRDVIMTHILAGRCVRVPSDNPENPLENGINSEVPDIEMRVAILDTLKHDLPCIPMLHLFRILKINHSANDSLRKVRVRIVI